MERCFSSLVEQPLLALLEELGCEASFDSLVRTLSSRYPLARPDSLFAADLEAMWGTLVHDALRQLQASGWVRYIEGGNWARGRVKAPGELSGGTGDSILPLTPHGGVAPDDRLNRLADELINEGLGRPVGGIGTPGGQDVTAILRLVSERMRSDVGIRRRVYRRIERDSSLSRLIKARRGYTCQVCGPHSSTVFETKAGVPYVETHHIDWLSRGGLDIEENVLVLCATCHRKFHYGPDSQPLRSEDGRDLTVVLCRQEIVIRDYARAVG